MQVVERVNADADDLQRCIRERAEHQRRSATIWHVGASVQIVSLVVVAAKDLV
ncbi:hypothetical protein [Blastococcus saxobsidens]|uniref:Uncharacterized protein n=1 Tax=Blastococcus saxobsidens TaxID=138336 RepID=A0A4Q7Y397_9ACTN|nr:hypothetical protein [Blastococcus saxobsidens]RZU30443.1 hypothetical protein BKA19_0059 [Blastococcus saxobsidens]